MNSDSINILLRSVNMEDMKQLFEWRNDETVRNGSISSEKIDWETHQRWLAKSLNDPHRYLLFAMNGSGNDGMGVLRFDVDQDNRDATLSIYLAPAYIGKGKGAAVIRAGQTWVKTHLPQVHSIRAKVLLDNIASQKIFEKTGFIEENRWYEQGTMKGIEYIHHIEDITR